MKSRARFTSYRVSGSDFVKTFKSRSRIFKQGSRRLGESRVLPFATPPCGCTEIIFLRERDLRLSFRFLFFF